MLVSIDLSLDELLIVEPHLYRILLEAHSIKLSKQPNLDCIISMLTGMCLIHKKVSSSPLGSVAYIGHPLDGEKSISFAKGNELAHVSYEQDVLQRRLIYPLYLTK